MEKKRPIRKPVIPHTVVSKHKERKKRLPVRKPVAPLTEINDAC